MQDLVRVRVADPAEQPRIGERALQRVILAREGGAKGCEIGGEHLEPAGVMVIEPVLASHEVKRGAPLRARLRQHEGSRGEVERRESGLRRDLGAGAPPVKSAGDHQVDDEEELPVERDHDAFSEAAQARHPPADRGVERRIDRAEQERARQAHPLEPGPDDSRLQRLDVNDDVGELRHRTSASDSAADHTPRRLSGIRQRLRARGAARMADAEFMVRSRCQ